MSVQCECGGSHEPWQHPTDEEIERRALYLQSIGPDEFPFGYYKFLAEKELTNG